MKKIPDLSNQTVLISGFHGFLGGITGAEALKTHAAVYGVDVRGNTPRTDLVHAALGVEGIQVYEANLSDPEAWLKILRTVRPNILLHLAGTTRRGNSVEDWSESVRGNILTTASLIQAVAMLSEPDRPIIIYPGSQMEYGATPMPWTEETMCRPVHPYGSSKLAATELLLSAARSQMIRTCVGRFPIIYGPAQAPTMFIPELIITALQGKPFKMTEGKQRRRFLFAGDAASTLISLGAAMLSNEALPSLLNMPASPPRSMREVAEIVAGCIHSPVTIEFGAIPSRPNEILDSWPEDTLAARLGLSCNTTLEEGLQKTVEWYQNNQWFWQGNSR